MSDTESDNDVPILSVESFAALQEFYSEQAQKEELLKTCKEYGHDYNASLFDEDWQLSQFWYDEDTVHTLGKEIKRIINENGKVALISCPTLYQEVKKLCDQSEVCLFEYDKRFAAFGVDYHFYDYKMPLDIPRNFGSYFDVVLADPPFLSKECLTKTAVTIKYLAKDKIILCTGSIMEDLAKRLLNLKKTNFKPHHKNNLANDFSCYTNYEVVFDR